MTPFKIISAGVLEIKGSYPNSPTMYVRSEYVQGFVVNHRSSTIELLFATGFPNKIVDCTSDHLPTSIGILTEFTSLKNLKPSALISMQEKLTSSMNDVRHLIALLGEARVDERFGSLEKSINDLYDDIKSLKNTTSIIGSSLTNIHAMMPMPLEAEAVETVPVEEAVEAVTEEEAVEAVPEEEPVEDKDDGVLDDMVSAEILVLSLLTATLFIGGLVAMFNHL
jgi:hypothetical protein